MGKLTVSAAEEHAAFRECIEIRCLRLRITIAAQRGGEIVRHEQENVRAFGISSPRNT